MFKYLTNYIVTDHELKMVNEDIHGKVQTCLSCENRLHSFLQMYEIAKVIIESLEAVDKAGFLSQIKEDVDVVHSKLSEQLQVQASELQHQIEEINKNATAAETELKKRGECIESVLTGMNKISDLDSEIREIKQRMDDIEQKMTELLKLRQSSAFEEMCKLANNDD